MGVEGELGAPREVALTRREAGGGWVFYGDGRRCVDCDFLAEGVPFWVWFGER